MSSNGNAGGIEFSEAEVKPTKEEVEASPEKVAEIKEAAEVQRATDEATITPESVKEKMEHAPAEDLMGALVEAVDAVPPPETPRAAQEDLNQGRPTESQSEGDPKAASEVQSVVSEVSTTAPDTTLEGSGKDDKVTIAETASEIPSRDDSPRTAESSAAEYLEEAGQPEMQEVVETVPEPERAEQTQSAAVPDLETVERDDGETKLVKDGGDDDKFDPGDGLKQAGDIREDTDISDKYGDDVIETGDGVDTLRDPGQAGTGIDDLPDLIPDLGEFTPGEGGGKEPGDLGGPDVGLNQDGERGDLAGAAAFGADARIGMDDDGDKTAPIQPDLTPSIGIPMDDTISAENGGGDDGGGGDISPADDGGKPADQGNATDKDGLEGNKVDGPTNLIDTIKNFTGNVWDAMTSDSNDSNPTTSTFGQRATPTPDGVENVVFDDTLDGKLREKALPRDSIFDQDLNGEAVSQPVDDDDASPKEPGISFDRATQTDPYSQDTGEDADTPSTGYEPDVDKLTPGMAGGDDGVLSPSSGITDPDEVGPEDPDKPSGEGPKPTKPD